jgi:23S rRNA (uracil1939-C5)-methyltransferase
MHIESNNNIFTKNQEVSLLIEKLLYGGSGLSHVGSMACLIDDVIPGETVLAKIATVKSHYITASLSAICEPSAQRTEPRCSLFKRCGGCQWQHIDYPVQLHWKKSIVKECLERIGGLRDISVLDTLPSPSSWHYRSRASLKMRASRPPAIGFYQRRTHYVIPVSFCPLLAPPLNQALAYCNTLCSENSPQLRKITEIHLLYSCSSNKVIITLCHESAIKSSLIFTPDREPYAAYPAAPASPNSVYSCYDDIMGVSFIRSPLSFYQINREQNTSMITTVLNYLAPSGSHKILDLYCGCGNFSIFLARNGASIVGIDSSRNAINEAISNAAANLLQNCFYVCGDVEKTISQFLNIGFDGVLINPPRRGCTPVTLNYINIINPRVIVYVSCNPATLARDLKALLSHGYCIEAIQPVDMFPQTYHIETIVKLIKA